MRNIKAAAARPKPAPPTLWDRYFTSLLWSIIAVAALLYILRNPQYRTGSFNDDAIYVIGARDFWRPAAARSALLKPDYPCPALPLLLSPFALLISSDWIMLESMTILFTVLLLLLAARWARQWLSSGETLAAIAMLAFAPVVARLSGAVMGASYFAFAVMGCCWLMSRWMARPSRRTAWALGMFTGWGSLVRPESAILVVSVAVPLAASRRGRRLLLEMAPALAVWGLFAAYWFLGRSFPASEYRSDLTALAGYWTTHFTDGMSFSATLILEWINRAFAGGMLPRALSPTILCVLSAGLWFGMAAGFRDLWRQKPDQRIPLATVALFIVLYFSAHVFWRASAARYVIPLLPFTFILVTRGIRRLWAGLPAKRIVIPATLGVVLALDGYRNVATLREYYTRPDPLNVPPWRSLDWIRRHTPVDTVILSNIAPTVELYARRQATSGVFSDNFEWFLYRLQSDRTAYVVLRNGGNFLASGVQDTLDPNRTWGRIRRWVAANPQWFEPLYEDAEEQTAMYRVRENARFMEAYGHFLRAVAEYTDDRDDNDHRAQRDFTAAIAAYPTLGSAYNFLGAIELSRDRPALAGANFQKAMQCLPDDPHAMLNMANVYRTLGDDREADAYVVRALDAGTANGNQGLWENNIRDLRQAWSERKARLFLDAPPAGGPRPQEGSFRHAP